MTDKSEGRGSCLKAAQIIVDNIHNKSQGLKFEARVGCERLFDEAYADTELIRSGRQVVFIARANSISNLKSHSVLVVTISCWS